MELFDLLEDYLIDQDDGLWSPEIISRPSKFNIVYFIHIFITTQTVYDR